jgi:hopanoid biosynthesis associated radical SAM protein HpnH
MPQIVRGYIERRKFVCLCTNALLRKTRMKGYQPSPYLTFSVHLDGSRERHDSSVCQSGVYDRVVDAIREARAGGFRATVNCTLLQNEEAEEVAQFMDECIALDVEGVTIAPGCNYERAPKQDAFLQRRGAMQLFRDVFRTGRTRSKVKYWRFNHSSLYLDFLAGNQNYQCTAWDNPTRNVFGWQKPCYLLVGEGSAKTYKDMVEEVDWSRWGVGRNPKVHQLHGALWI